MTNPKKAYFVHATHDGCGFVVAPCLVLAARRGDPLAVIALLNVTKHSAWIPTLGAQQTVRVDSLASTRLKALAKVALYLENIEARLLAPKTASAPRPAAEPEKRLAVPVSAPVAPEPMTPGGPRRAHKPWWQNQD